MRKQALVPANVPTAYWENWWTEDGPVDVPDDFADLTRKWPEGWVRLLSDREDRDAEIDAEVLQGRLLSGLHPCVISDYMAPRAGAIAEWVETWRGRNAYHLSTEVECGEPDAPESAGAKFLESVRDGLCDMVEERADEDDESWDEQVHEIADGAPDVYTYTRWAEFVDLAAYQEEPEVTGEWPQDLTEAAGLALYQIAERLCGVMLENLRETIREAEDG